MDDHLKRELQIFIKFINKDLEEIKRSLDKKDLDLFMFNVELLKDRSVLFDKFIKKN